MSQREKKDSEPAPRHRLLVVDDEASIRGVLKFYLEKHGYEVTTAASGAEALKLARLTPVDLVILDVLLRDSDGLDVLVKLKKARPSRPVILITGLETDAELKLQARTKGAAECVSKMSPLDELRTSIERALELLAAPSPDARAAPPNRLARRATAARVSESFKPRPPGPAPPPALAPKAAPVLPAEPGWITQLISITPESVRFECGTEVFLRMLAAYHPNLGNTAMRAVVLCRALGGSLQLPLHQRQSLMWAAALHDIALVQMDSGLVRRWMRGPEKCTREELALIKQHPVRAQRLLEFYPALREAGEIIRAHHENWDGTGFPDGLKMETIPWLARLLAIVTFYCSKHQPNERTISEIQFQAHRLFDPKAVEAVRRVAPAVRLPRGQREVLVYELKPGMVLADEIVNSNGVAIVGRNSELNRPMITKIIHLTEAGKIDRRALVFA